MTQEEAGGAAGWRPWLLRVAAGAAVVGLAVVAGRVLPGEPAPADRADGPKLHRWDLLGCYALRVGPWSVEWRETGAGAPGGARAPDSGGPAGESRGPGSRGGPASAGGDLPASFAPPGRLVLLPDSVDRWGRVLPSRRAEPLDGGDHRGRSLRWLVRGDTLWLVWSEGDTRAGVALRPSGDSLAGRVRTIRSGDSLDATAPASARRINCWTRAPEGVDAFRRR